MNDGLDMGGDFVPANDEAVPAPLTPHEIQQLFKINALRSCAISMSFMRDAVTKLPREEAAMLLPVLKDVVVGAALLGDAVRERLASEGEPASPLFHAYIDHVQPLFLPPNRTN